MRKNLKKARMEAGLTQEGLAELLGISTIHYQKIEAGERTGSFEIWDKLEDIMRIHQRVLREMSETRRAPEENR